MWLSGGQQFKFYVHSARKGIQKQKAVKKIMFIEEKPNCRTLNGCSMLLYVAIYEYLF